MYVDIIKWNKNELLDNNIEKTAEELQDICSIFEGYISMIEINFKIDYSEFNESNEFKSFIRDVKINDIINGD